MLKNLAKYVGLFLVLATIPAAFALLKPGFWEPHDLHHLADIFEMYRAASLGQIPPRLGPDFLWGWGYPLFNFYYVLPFYLGAGFYAFTKSLTGSFEFVFLVSIIVSVVAMYLFLREFFGKAASFTGSILYLYTPYRAVQIYVRGAIGEALTMAILPLVFWAAVRLIKKPKMGNIAILAFVIAAFILSHNYLWLLTLPALLLFLAGLYYFGKFQGKSVKAVLFSAVLGLGISSYWWFPAVSEFRLLSGQTPFPLQDHFPFIKQLILPSWGYGASLPGPYDGISFQIGIINLVAIVMGVALLILKKVSLKKGFIAYLSLLGFFAAVILMNIRTLSLWKALPIYQFVQFPWRLLFLTTFFSSVVGGFAVESFPKNLRWYIGGAIILASVLVTLGYFKPSGIFTKTDDFYLSRMFATVSEEGERKSVSAEYLNWSEDYLLLPSGVQKPNRLPVPRIYGDSDADVSEIVSLGPTRYKAQVEASAPAKVTFSALYLPGWFSKVDGQDAQVSKGEPYGQMEIFVPSGIHEVEFYWAETPKRKIVDLISVISLGVALVLLGKSKFKSNAKE